MNTSTLHYIIISIHSLIPLFIHPHLLSSLLLYFPSSLVLYPFYPIVCIHCVSLWGINLALTLSFLPSNLIFSVEFFLIPVIIPMYSPWPREWINRSIDSISSHSYLPYPTLFLFLQWSILSPSIPVFFHHSYHSINFMHCINKKVFYVTSIIWLAVSEWRQ